MKKIFLMSVAVLFAFSAQALEILYNGAYLQGVTDKSAYIVWTTDVASESWVEISGGNIKGTKIVHETQLGNKLVRRNHIVPVTGLTPATTYTYKVYSKDPKNSKVVSQTENAKGAALTFKTLDHNKESISWIMATDIHYNKYIENLFQTIFTPERLEGRDFVIFDGDIADSFSSEKRHYESLFATVTSTFASNLPYYMARGNHETRGAAASQYLNFHPTWTGMPYFAFRHGPVFFIFLDGGEDKPDSDIEYYGTAVFDEFRRNEGEWLAKVVESKEFKEAAFRVVITHIPLFPQGWHGATHAHKMLAPHLDKGEIDVAISGHTHRYAYREIGQDNQTFPTLIFAPKNYLDINADSKTLKIDVKDLEGNVLNSFSYESKKK